MGCPAPPIPKPTLAGFTAYVYGTMGIPQAAIGNNTIYIEWAFGTAISTVNLYLSRARGPAYLQAVYGLAGDWLVNWCPDNGFLYPTKNPQKLGYFAYLRKQFGLGNFVAGVISASADVTTSQTLTVPKQFEALTIDQLQNLKTPWGRQYLGIAQKVGSNWGIS